MGKLTALALADRPVLAHPTPVVGTSTERAGWAPRERTSGPSREHTVSRNRRHARYGRAWKKRGGTSCPASTRTADAARMNR